MPLSKRIIETTLIQEEIIEKVPVTTYIEKKKIITKQVNREVLNHKNVEYNDKKYVVGYVPFNDTEDILFVFDDIKRENVILRRWHIVSDNYISSTIIDPSDGKTKQLYLHNFVMGKLTFNGKGQTNSIDHINRIPRDNRLENLRELSQTQQNYNQSKWERNVELPADCGIDPNDIPTNISYRKSDGIHGDRFLIDIKLPGERIRDQSTSSKNINLKTKLQEAILKLKKIREEHPEIKEIDDILDNVKKRDELARSFNVILMKSGFPQQIIDKNLAPLEKVPEEKINVEAENLAKQLIDIGLKGVKTSLPADCGVTQDMIPKHCYYKPETEKRGGKFIIERHPILIAKGVRQWATTESKSKTIKQKFDLLMEKYNDLEK